jgi:hypothetical protein
MNDPFISQFPLVGAAGRHELRRIRRRPIAGFYAAPWLARYAAVRVISLTK